MTAVAEAAVKPKVEKIIAVLQAEKQGLCRGSLCDPEAVYKDRPFLGCFMGALLYRAGWSKAEIDALDPGLDGEDRARATLLRVYGLSDDHVDQGIIWNDTAVILGGYWDDEKGRFVPDIILETPLQRRDRIIGLVLKHWS